MLCEKNIRHVARNRRLPLSPWERVPEGRVRAAAPLPLSPWEEGGRSPGEGQRATQHRRPHSRTSRDMTSVHDALTNNRSFVSDLVIGLQSDELSRILLTTPLPMLHWHRFVPILIIDNNNLVRIRLVPSPGMWPVVLVRPHPAPRSSRRVFSSRLNPIIGSTAPASVV
jgi:hypothetical protein